MLIMDFNIMRCTHCGSDKYVKNGPYQGSQRFRCKNCLRYFSDKVSIVHLLLIYQLYHFEITALNNLVFMFV